MNQAEMMELLKSMRRGKRLCHLKKSALMIGQRREARRQRRRWLWWAAHGKTSGIGGGCDAIPLVSMSSLAWNCKGLRNRRTVLALKKVVTSEDPILIFLIKTKLVVSEWKK